MADPLPLPPPPNRFAIELTATGKRLDYTADDMRAYGDAREAAGRRAALLEAAELVRNYSTAGGVVVFRTEVVNALRERANG